MKRSRPRRPRKLRRQTRTQVASLLGLRPDARDEEIFGAAQRGRGGELKVWEVDAENFRRLAEHLHLPDAAEGVAIVAAVMIRERPADAPGAAADAWSEELDRPGTRAN